MDLPRGKHMLTAVMNGSALDSDFSTNEFLVSLQRLSRYMRWVATSSLPDVFLKRVQSPDRTFPEASTLFAYWTAVEDVILSSLVDFCLKFTLGHLSLHYDGIRLDAELPCSIQDFCEQASSHVFEKHGFKVTLREKTHLTFAELVALHFTDRCTILGRDAVLSKRGNCIASAVCHLAFKSDELIAGLKEWYWKVS